MPWGSPPTRRSTPPASTSCRAASTCTRTWRCRSAARSRATRSRPARSPRRGAASRRSSTSPCRTPAPACRTPSAAGTRRPTATAPSTTRFHQIIGGVDEESLKAMTYLVDNEGITSFKLFMAYPGVLYSDDGQILRAMQTANESGAMIMMHAENGIAIDVLVAQAIARGETDPQVPLADPPGRARGRGDAPGDPARQGRRQRAAVHRAHVGVRGVGGGRRGPPRRRQRVRRDVPAVPLPVARGPARPARLRGRQVGLLDAAAHEARAPPGRPLEGPADERAGRRVDRPLPVLLQGPEGDGDRRLLQDPQRHRQRRAPHGADLPGRRRRRDHARALGRDVLHDAGADVRHVPAQGDHRPRRRRRHPRVGPERAHVDRLRQEAPHEHGPLGVGGLRGRRQGRHRPQPRAA